MIPSHASEMHEFDTLHRCILTEIKSGAFEVSERCYIVQCERAIPVLFEFFCLRFKGYIAILRTISLIYTLSVIWMLSLTKKGYR